MSDSTPECRFVLPHLESPVARVLIDLWGRLGSNAVNDAQPRPDTRSSAGAGSEADRSVFLSQL